MATQRSAEEKKRVRRRRGQEKRKRKFGKEVKTDLRREISLVFFLHVLSRPDQRKTERWKTNAAVGELSNPRDWQ
jgi:hypothetical protein